MFLERAFESYIEDIQDVFSRASAECEEAVDAVYNLAWNQDDLLTAIEDGEDYDTDACDELVQRCRDRIERGANDASSQGSEVDYYDAYDAILEAVKDEFSNNDWFVFADKL